MGMKFAHLAGVTLSLLAATAFWAPESKAQFVEAETPQTIPDAVDDLLSDRSGTFFENRSWTRQGGNIVGLGFRDREILRDAAVVAEEIDALLLLQNTSDPTIRVPDLANPYTASLLTLPSGEAPTLGTEFIFEPF